MVERIRITPSNITTKDASGNITFSTDTQYLKTDATGILKVGGYQSVPTPAGYFGNINDTSKGWYCPSIINIPRIYASSSFYYPIPKYSELVAGDDYNPTGYYSNGTYNYSPFLDHVGYKSSTISLTTSFGETIGSYNWTASYQYAPAQEEVWENNQGGSFLISPFYPERFDYQFTFISNLIINNFDFNGIPYFTFTDPLTWYSAAEGYTIASYEYLITQYPQLNNTYIMTKSNPLSLGLKVTQ